MTGHGQSVTHVLGIKRNLCVQNGPNDPWRARKEGATGLRNLDKIDITSLAYRARDTT